MCKEYNGYTNYQTWNVSLWLDNTYELYTQIRDKAEELQEEYAEDDDFNDEIVYKLEDYLQTLVDEMNSLTKDASMFTDILGSALAEVDYREIAENILNE